MSKTFSKDEVAGHKTPQDLFIIVDDDVYDMTQFQSEHPGGQKSSFLVSHYDEAFADIAPSSTTSRWEGRFQAILEIPQ